MAWSTALAANVSAGRVTEPHVAEALGYDYTDTATAVAALAA